MKISRAKNKPLGKIELIAIALGGMIGGGIFSILGISVEMVGGATPIAIFLGGLLAFCAAYSYSKLATYYKDEGATYSFFKKTFPNHTYAIAAIGWLIVFGYISTLALYAFTFASYTSSFFADKPPGLIQYIAFSIIVLFGGINLLSVTGMGRVEDFMVYTKVLILAVISGLFLFKGNEPHTFSNLYADFSLSGVITVAAITFVAYEGFQLVIHAYEEVSNPEKNVPSSIYWAIASATLIYVVLSLAAIHTIPEEFIIRDKEFALAAGASNILGPWGYGVVILGALLATSSAINGTIFGASRLMAVIAKDGVFPPFLAKRSKGHIPHFSVVAMCALSYLFILRGGLRMIVEFGSITFIVVSFLMAYANFHIRDKTKSHIVLTVLAMILLGIAALLIFAYEAHADPKQLAYIVGLYVLLSVLAKIYSVKVQPFES